MARSSQSSEQTHSPLTGPTESTNCPLLKLSDTAVVFYAHYAASFLKSSPAELADDTEGTAGATFSSASPVSSGSLLTNNITTCISARNPSCRFEASQWSVHTGRYSHDRSPCALPAISQTAVSIVLKLRALPSQARCTCINLASVQKKGRPLMACSGGRVEQTARTHHPMRNFEAHRCILVPSVLVCADMICFCWDSVWV